jgi:hypothetical protein
MAGETEGLAVDAASRFRLPPGQPKVTGDIEYRFDTDGDGSLDKTQTVKKYSLEYHHATTGADMVFSLEPLSVEDARLDLSVLAANYVERSSGSGTVAISIGPGVAIEHTKKYASRILDARATTVGGLPAYVVTFDLANVDQLGLSPDSRWRRARASSSARRTGGSSRRAAVSSATGRSSASSNTTRTRRTSTLTSRSLARWWAGSSSWTISVSFVPTRTNS